MGQGASNIRTQVDDTPTGIGDAPRSRGQYIGGRAERSTGRMANVERQWSATQARSWLR